MTDEELQEIEDRCNKATAGPWWEGLIREQAWIGKGENFYGQVPPGEVGVCPCCLKSKNQPSLVRTIEEVTYHFHKDDCWTEIYAASGDLIVGMYDYDMGGVASTKEDAKFIAHARHDVPSLLAEVERLSRRISKESIKKAIDEALCQPHIRGLLSNTSVGDLATDLYRLLNKQETLHNDQ